MPCFVGFAKVREVGREGRRERGLERAGRCRRKEVEEGRGRGRKGNRKKVERHVRKEAGKEEEGKRRQRSQLASGPMAAWEQSRVVRGLWSETHTDYGSQRGWGSAPLGGLMGSQ